jgi:hypothetical protein
MPEHQKGVSMGGDGEAVLLARTLVRSLVLTDPYRADLSVRADPRQRAQPHPSLFLRPGLPHLQGLASSALCTRTATLSPVQCSSCCDCKDIKDS